MKFKFCSDGDCPLWALAALHASSSLSVQLFRNLLECVVDGQNDDAVMEILKDTNLSSRDESARIIAVIRWTMKQAWSSSCSGAQLSRDLLVIGVPRPHAQALAEVVDNGRGEWEKKVAEAGFMINRITDTVVAPGPEGAIDAIKLSFFTDDITGEKRQKDLLIEKGQTKLLLEELKKAYQRLEELAE